MFNDTAGPTNADEETDADPTNVGAEGARRAGTVIFFSAALSTAMAGGGGGASRFGCSFGRRARAMEMEAVRAVPGSSASSPASPSWARAEIAAADSLGEK